MLWWHIISSFDPCHVIFQLLVLVMSHNILNLLYLDFHQTNWYQRWQGDDLPWGSSTLKINGVIKSHNKLNTLCFYLQMTCEYQTEVGDLHDRLPPLKSHGPLITWSTYGHLTSWKKAYLLSTKLCRMVTSGRRFRPQTPKSSPTPCLILIQYSW